ncbi:MAG: 1-acyl-sn-glycerol-3-phosphate acyltransferase [Candidatus Rokubacteria bacterium]|nr:1-acyl-sn-glycerol-3-phosphate acyltransferase [Candidatus Rokubacteria bacterium]
MTSAEDRSAVSILPRPAALPAPCRDGEGFPLLYRLLRTGCAPVLRVWFDLAVEGTEHLPPSGPFILAANHHNYLDGVVLGVALPKPIAFLVMPRVYRASPLHPAFHRHIRSIPINLQRPDPGAIKRALRVLEDGGVLGIFPEGPFSRQGRLMPGQPGVATIALRSGAPVVPAAIRGTFEALAGQRFYLPRRHPLSVSFGPPVHATLPRHRRATRDDREEFTRRVMAQIAALLDRGPEPMREARAWR